LIPFHPEEPPVYHHMLSIKKRAGAIAVKKSLKKYFEA
jgi:hypothetical protein